MRGGAALPYPQILFHRYRSKNRSLPDPITS